jgi:hypothetical protein
MFDVQKYLHIFSIGYIIYDFIFCIFVAENDGLMLQTYLHHVLVMVGNTGGIFVGGTLGNLSQITWLTEGSTPFVNFRQTLAWHKQESTLIYKINGLTMTAAFFVFRVIFYSYMIFGTILPFCMDPKTVYETPIVKGVSFFLIALYVCMYFLNLGWFYKMVVGCLKALGVIKKTPKKNVSTNKVE